MIKAAAIGAGRRGASIHYPAIKRLKDVDLVAACDLDENLLREKADRFEIPHRFTDYKEMLQSVGHVDIVYTVTQPMHVARIALDCLERRKTRLYREAAGYEPRRGEADSRRPPRRTAG